MRHAGKGENAPYPKYESQRLGYTQMEDKARAADPARQRASNAKLAARDPKVAALFGPYSEGSSSVS